MHLELPPQKLRFMNEIDDKFKSIGLNNLNEMKKHGFSKTSFVLDIGSGYGRLAYAINENMPEFCGKYMGVDILERHINWCKDSIGNKLSWANFKYIDIKNSRYNPKALLEAKDFIFDFDNGQFDYVVLFSVFTHMYEKDIVSYLREINRLLKPGGICLATFFLFDDERLKLINSTNSGITLHHKLNSHTRFYNQADPLHAIGFLKSHIIDIVNDLGLGISECQYGSWAGDRSARYQDLLVLKKD